ncbi:MULTISPECIES: hypothetical protein [unclassified Streptomyces]|uniref:hypothetical protein n=1 Tax=unclassified Streptomyces TaxID=2593676 RepID=UPI001F07CE76|nr:MULTISPECIES: hypothetical protein [unclassified Streptomyces]
MREVDQLDAEGGDILRAEVREILGARADRAVFEALVHNLKNGVTGGVWRVTVGDRSLVLKALTRGKDTGGESGRTWSIARHTEHARRLGAAHGAALTHGADAPHGADAVHGAEAAGAATNASYAWACAPRR